MASFNKIIIVGYCGRDPEIRYAPSGTAICNLSIATTEKRKGRSGESEDVTTWFRCSLFSRQAELANQYLKKGSQVSLMGRLRQEEYVDKDGNRRQSLEVTVTDLNFLDSKGRTETGGGSEGYDDSSSPFDSSGRPTSSGNRQNASGGGEPREKKAPLTGPVDDDIPFAFSKMPRLPFRAD